MAAHATTTTADRIAETPGPAFDSHHQDGSEIELSGAGSPPAAGRLIGRMIYRASYAVSFGVTLPVMMIVRVVPRDNALVHGLVDGALAARDRVDDWGAEVEPLVHDDEDHGLHESGNGAIGHDEATDHAAPRRPRTRKAATRKTTRSSPRKKS